MVKYQPSETVICSAEIYSSANVLSAPGTITITIKDSNGKKVVTAQTPTLSSTGIYSYDYTLDAAPEKGVYEITWTVTKDSRTTIQRDYFEVVS